MINGQTRLAGVIGWPVSHSRSPLLHNYWCEKHQINGAYIPLSVAPEKLEVAVRGVAASGFCGANVTIPHKEAVFRLCDERTVIAERSGAVNTLYFRDGKLIGDCTDGTGFCDNVRAHGSVLEGSVLILGAGGAARAIAASLLDCGCQILITNRSIERAQALVRALGAGGVVPWDEWPDSLAKMTMVVNATSLGMGGRSDLNWEQAFAKGPHDLCVADIVYTPRNTPMLQAARTQGWKTIDGLGMLICQARAGFAEWFGVVPDVDKGVFAMLARDLNLEALD